MSRTLKTGCVAIKCSQFPVPLLNLAQKVGVSVCGLCTVAKSLWPFRSLQCIPRGEFWATRTVKLLSAIVLRKVLRSIKFNAQQASLKLSHCMRAAKSPFSSDWTNSWSELLCAVAISAAIMLKGDDACRDALRGVGPGVAGAGAGVRAGHRGHGGRGGGHSGTPRVCTPVQSSHHIRHTGSVAGDPSR